MISLTTITSGKPLRKVLKPMFDEYGPFMSTQDCCEALMVGKNTIYDLIKQGKISGARVGSRIWRITKASMINYIMIESGLTMNLKEKDNELI